MLTPLADALLLVGNLCGLIDQEEDGCKPTELGYRLMVHLVDIDNADDLDTFICVIWDQ